MSAERSGLKLLRILGPVATTAILIGSVIGSGIFLVPNTVAAQVGSFGPIMILWLAAGLLTLFGALSYAELGGMIPDAGGQYAYLREAYGRFPAFLFGWTEFLVVKAGSIAAVAVAFALYMGYFLPESFQVMYHKTVVLNVGFTFPIKDIGVKCVAILCIVALSAVNYIGLKLGSFVQNVFTFLKVAALFGLIALIFIWGNRAPDAMRPFWPSQWSPDLWRGIGVAAVAVLWAYDGWNNTTYIAEEALEPQRTIPRALFLGTVIVVLVYLAANLAYAYVLPLREIASSNLVAADALRTFLGTTGGAFIAAAVMISTFGTVNGMILSGPRVTYAMSQDKVFFRSMGMVHTRFRTPHVSVAIQGVWSALLTLSGTFDQLFTYVIFAAWLFYAMTTASVFVLRKKWPDRARPYRTWGYPWIPLIFLLASALLVVNTLITDPRDSLFGLVIILLGVPVYLFWKRRNRKNR